MSLKAKIAVLTAVAFMNSAVAFAQTANSDLGNQILNETAQQMTNTMDGFFRILRIILIIGAAISLIMVGFNVIQGERDSMKKAGWWVVGLVVSLGGLAVLNAFGNNL